MLLANCGANVCVTLTWLFNVGDSNSAEKVELKSHPKFTTVALIFEGRMFGGNDLKEAKLTIERLNESMTSTTDYYEAELASAKKRRVELEQRVQELLKTIQDMKDGQDKVQEEFEELRNQLATANENLDIIWDAKCDVEKLFAEATTDYEKQIAVLRNQLGLGKVNKPQAPQYDVESVASISRTMSQSFMEDTKSYIYSCFVEKKNRRGYFQKRLIRFDGCLFVCLTEKKYSTSPRNCKIAEYALSSSSDLSVKEDFANSVSITYPGRTTLRSLAHCLLADSILDVHPNPSSCAYFAPKWVVKLSDITLIEKVDETTFSITTATEILTFKAYPEEVDKWMLMLSQMRKRHLKEPLVHDNPTDRAAASQMLRKFLNNRIVWMKVLKSLSGDPKSNISTLLWTPKGVEGFKGIKSN